MNLQQAKEYFKKKGGFVEIYHKYEICDPGKNYLMVHTDEELIELAEALTRKTR